MQKIRNMKLEIKDLEISINKVITIKVLNFLSSFFIRFLCILSYKVRKKVKFLSLKSLTKLLEDKKYQIKNEDEAIANYTK